MALQCEPTPLPGVLVFRPDRFGDPRGFFMETYHREKYRPLGLDRDFVQDNFSHSGRGTLRGLHFQLRRPQAKLVMVLAGEVYDVAVDLRRGSPHFGKWFGMVLSGDNGKQLFIPEGFAHGFCVVSEQADFLYKCTDFYDPADDRGILWSDPAIGIPWPGTDFRLSAKDERLPKLAEMADAELPVFR
ncbi:MAG: dTDP-4-dehydrorhamnose 3,5-epimerase [Kiritimatiellae bacterium]|nr:dTDP-4-dehydrorhamnose 3,5-epimerase [Kiritimatiellia bacterium]